MRTLGDARARHPGDGLLLPAGRIGAVQGAVDHGLVERIVERVPVRRRGAIERDGVDPNVAARLARPAEYFALSGSVS